MLLCFQLHTQEFCVKYIVVAHGQHMPSVRTQGSLLSLGPESQVSFENGFLIKGHCQKWTETFQSLSSETWNTQSPAVHGLAPSEGLYCCNLPYTCPKHCLKHGHELSENVRLVTFVVLLAFHYQFACFLANNTLTHLGFVCYLCVTLLIRNNFKLSICMERTKELSYTFISILL